VDHRFPSDHLTLAAHLAHPADSGGGFPGLVLCHGFPAGVAGARASQTYPQLADRIAVEMGWVVLALNFRGCEPSQGDFSLGGWERDIRHAVTHLHDEHGTKGVWVAGFGTGGALGICAGSHDTRIRGVAAVGAPADFDDWAQHPRRALDHARDIGLVHDPAFPLSFDQWARELKQIRAVACASSLAPRPLLVLHGSEDQTVPPLDARVVADAHGDAELRFIQGAGHQLRHDPRAVAVLLGWLDRQKQSSRR
jgi:putative redox protein